MAPNLVQIWMLSVSQKESNIHCIEVIFVRSGKQIGNESFFPKNAKGETCEKSSKRFFAFILFRKKYTYTKSSLVTNWKTRH